MTRSHWHVINGLRCQTLGVLNNRCLLCNLPLSNLCTRQPQNILLTSARPLGDIRIVDFGLSRRMDSITEVREILGTPEYVGESCIRPAKYPDSPVSFHFEWHLSWLIWAMFMLLLQHQRSWIMSPLPLQQTCGKCVTEVEAISRHYTF